MKSLLREIVLNARNKADLYRAPRNAIDEMYVHPCNSKCNRDLNVAVVAMPCHNFGDIIFATKFARYLKYGLSGNSRPYSNRVSIITSAPTMFTKLGVADIKIIPLKGGSIQCRRLRSFNRPGGLKPYDLIFIAPLMADFNINHSDVKKLFKESTPFNTIFLSEYQDDLRKGFDIATGVGTDFDGLLFDGEKPSPKLCALGSIPYAVAYVNLQIDVLPCLRNFCKMIAVKYYKKYSYLQIVLPELGAVNLARNNTFRKFIADYYPSVILRTKRDQTKLRSGVGGTLILRGDIFPVTRPDMLSMIKHSIQDILVTGDQSITDVVDCCAQKNIWYQIVPWKQNFAKALSDAMPQRYLSKTSTSCGTLKAVRWNNKRTNFKAKHDFRKKAKRKLDIIFRAASDARNKDTIIHKYITQLEQSASKRALLQVLE